MRGREELEQEVYAMGADFALFGIIALLGVLTLIGMLTQESAYRKTTYEEEEVSEDNSSYYELYNEYAEESNDYEVTSGIYQDMYEDDMHKDDDITDPAYCYLDYNIYHSLCDTDLDDDISTHDYYDDDDFHTFLDDDYYWLDNDN